MGEFTSGGFPLPSAVYDSIHPDRTASSRSGDLGEKWPLNFAYETSLHLLHAVNLRHGTGGFTSPPKEVVQRIFITLKNPSTSAGIEPATLGPVASTLTTSPPRQMKGRYQLENIS
jgi:hypothetical protein